MKNRILFIFFTCLFSSTWAFSQISHGGTPLYPENRTLKSSGNSDFIEMPSFDLDSVLRLDEINKENMRGSYQFAHKFYTNIKKGRDGNEFSLPDGTKIWQVGIRSKGAYSLNLLFTNYHLPEGGKLFIYSADHSYVIGSFDHRNNSSDGILPVRPVAGEAIIVEYSEPADAEFEGELVIGEVNHDYRDILNREPDIDKPNDYLCMPDALCGNVDETIIRATVLLAINGTTACTGTLVNNAKNDETPYILTAVHCLNPEIEDGIYKGMDHYITRAGTIVAFFNYNRSVCDTKMKATEEMSMAITHVKAILEKKDVALLQLQEKPPRYYNAYYAGFNVNEQAGNATYTNIHHPSAAVKKYGLFTGNLTLNMGAPYSFFDSNSHWKIPAWSTGSTYGGSSGSPLFNKNNQIIGTLSGGNSFCSGKNPNGEPDFFTALYKSWETTDPENQLKKYLDPDNTGIKQLAGFDPNKDDPFFRIGNVNYNGGVGLVTTKYASPHTGFLFGNSDLEVVEFAEEFNLSYTSDLYGTYLLIPTMPFAYTSGVEIQVYNGELSPEKKVATQIFNPQYLGYNAGRFGNVPKNTNSVPTETFVVFNNTVEVGKKFFIAYKINYSTGSSFAVYNAEFKTGYPNTAWLKEGNGKWTPASAYQTHPITTSLAIQPLLRYTYKSAIPDIENKKADQIQYVRSENRLILPGEVGDAGSVHIYSVSGQLIQKISVRKEQNSTILQPQLNGTIGIVRILRGNEVYSGKIIY
jgi:hypothetical protein